MNLTGSWSANVTCSGWRYLLQSCSVNVYSFCVNVY